MNTTQYEESALIAAAQQGDRQAFGALVRRYQQRIYAVAYQYVRNREDALEMSQEAFVRAYRAMYRFDTSLPFYPWLKRIVTNTCLNHLKKKKRHAESSLDKMMDSGFDAMDRRPSPMAQAALGDVQSAIRGALLQLSEEHQKILRLRHFQEYSYTEIAQALEIPEGTVMSRLHAARKQLRRTLEREKVATANI